MAKFRSWNKEYRNFIYWENGTYFFEEKIRVNLEDKFKKFFDWQNKEQSLEINDIKGKEIFIGDNIQFEDSTLEMNGIDESAYEFINKATVVKSGICFTLENFLSKDEDTEVYNKLDEIEYLDELKSLFEHSEVISNIHEEVRENG